MEPLGSPNNQLLLQKVVGLNQALSSTDVKTDLWGIQLQRAVNARSHAGQNDTSISFEALCSSINEGDDGAGIQNSVFVAQEGYLTESNKQHTVKALKHATVNKMHLFSPAFHSSSAWQ